MINSLVNVNCYWFRKYSITDFINHIEVIDNVSDGIGLLGGTINHFVSYDEPPKV